MLRARAFAAVRELYAKGLERMPRMLALERNQAALKGQIGRLTGQVAQLPDILVRAGPRVRGCSCAESDQGR